jgi:hypothetical protein
MIFKGFFFPFHNMNQTLFRTIQGSLQTNALTMLVVMGYLVSSNHQEHALLDINGFMCQSCFVLRRI